MTQPNLDFFVRRGIAVKIEATENTDSTPSTSADGILLMNGSADTQFDKKERQIDRPFFTNNTFAVGNKSAYIEGNFELFAPTAPGSGANQYPACDVLLQCAGMASTLNATAKTTKYNPITNSIPSATAYWWHTDTYLKVTGSRNNISSIKMEMGSIYGGKVHIQGNYTTVTKSALPTITTYGTVPIVCTYDVSECGITNPVGGSELLVWGKSLEVIFGNKLASKEYTQTKKSAISDRKATWNLRIAKADLTDFNPWTVRDAGTLISMRMRTYETGLFGVRNGLYSELIVRGQIDTIKEVNIDDDLGWDLSGNCVASSAGGDEFGLTFGDDTIVITTAYPSGVHGATAITQTFSASSKALQGVQAWTVIAGALPTGVTLNPTTGAYGGTSSAGTFSWTVQVTDSSTPYPQVVTKQYTSVVLS
jgi:hypothetical protein